MNGQGIHSYGDLIVTIGTNARPRAFEVQADGSLVELPTARAIALASERHPAKAVTIPPSYRTDPTAPRRIYAPRGGPI